MRIRTWGRGWGGTSMVKAAVRYTRIPDPAHVLTIRGRARGQELKADNYRMRCPNKNVSSRIWFLISWLTRWDPV